MTEWIEASEDVVRVGREMITQYHPDLEEANIGFLFRDTAQKSGDRVVWGKASKVPDRLKPLLDYDFIIWIAEDLWEGELTEQQREALVDHELCHCGFNDNGKPVMRRHDIEEFKCVVERHGIWTDELAAFAEVIEEALEQPALPLALRGVKKEGGRVEAVKAEALGSAASLEG
jgi:hypothetical protein